MKTTIVAMIAALSVMVLSGSSAQAFPDTCSEAGTYCQQPRGGGACDARCMKYCADQTRVCKKTGTFKTRNNTWTGLSKR